MTVTPVTPVDRERLVPTSTSIIIDFTDVPTLVTVDAVTVYDGGFQNGWLGYLLNHPTSGKRLVLDPPSLFTINQTVLVHVEEGATTLDFLFEPGTTKITTTDDARSPRITDADGTSYVSYVRDPGELKLRIADPLGSETPVVDGTIVDIGYDATLDKLIVLFVNNGKVFVTAADPGDVPSTLVQPSVLDNDLSVGSPASSGLTPQNSFLTADFRPLKVAVPTENLDVGSPASGGLGSVLSAFPRTITPTIVSAPPNPVIVRFPRPTNKPENSLIVGVIPIKFVPGSGYHSLAFLPFPDLLTGISFIDFQDPVITLGSRYKAIVVYRRNDSPGTINSAIGGGGSLPTAADIFKAPAAGGGLGITRDINLASFPPIKLATAPDALDVGSPAGGGLGIGFSSTGFPPIGVG